MMHCSVKQWARTHGLQWVRNCNSLKSLGEFTLNDKHFKKCARLSAVHREEAAKNAWVALDKQTSVYASRPAKD